MPGAQAETLDVITIGRASVDLYGQQIGSRLEDIASFAKSVGGCPANIAVGTARLGLRSALITRVGHEQMGGFIREQLAREGVDDSRHHHRPGPADRAGAAGGRGRRRLADDLLSRRLRRHGAGRGRYRRALHRVGARRRGHRHAFLAAQHRRRRSGRRSRIAKASGGKVVFDIDYRPNLWGLAGHAAGFERYVRSDRVSEQLRTVLPDCDLMVGTEEEIMIASGADDVAGRAESHPRASTAAVIVLKRGAMGCIVYDGPISAPISRTASSARVSRSRSTTCSAPATPSCRGFCAAGSAARAWRRRPPGPMPAAPSPCRACSARRNIRPGRSCSYFLQHGSPHHALRKDAAINHIHWATTRRSDMPALMALGHRPPRAVGRSGAPRSAPIRRRIAALQGAGGQGGGQGREWPQRLRHADRRAARPRGDVRLRPTSLLLARPAGRAAGLAPAALRILAGHRLAAGRMAGRPLHQMPVLLPSRRSGRS